MLFILPDFPYAFLLARLWCFCGCRGLLRLSESSSWASPKLLTPALCRSNGQTLQAAFVPKKSRVFMWLFLQQMPIFPYSTLHCFLSLWICKLLRLRKPSCLLFPLSLSHDFLLKVRALLRQSVRFNILFKLNVLGWPNQMLAGWPQEWEPRYSVI